MARYLTIDFGTQDEKSISQIVAIASMLAAKTEILDTESSCTILIEEWPHG